VVAAVEEAPKAQIIDLMEALKASLGAGGGKAVRAAAGARTTEIAEASSEESSADQRKPARRAPRAVKREAPAKASRK
jgi:DNA end-binding protein Ku